MTLIRDISNHVRSLGQKLSASNIHNLGQKSMNTAHVIGRKASNTLSKIEEIGKKAIPIIGTAASMLGYPEIGGALASASNGLKRISNAWQNVDSLRNMLHNECFFLFSFEYSIYKKCL